MMIVLLIVLLSGLHNRRNDAYGWAVSRHEAPPHGNRPRQDRRTPTRRVKDSPLTESDWVHAATEILVQENVRGIKIDKLCAKLGVTKGSFYWHFRQRSDILTALLKDWRRRAT